MKSLSPLHEQLGDIDSLYPEQLVSFSGHQHPMFVHGSETELAAYTQQSHNEHCYGHGHGIALTTDCTNVTAINKSIMVNGVCDGYEGKHPSTWSSPQLALWLNDVCKQCNLDYQRLRQGLDSLSGDRLLSMPKEEFIDRFHSSGAIIHDAFHRHLHNIGFTQENNSGAGQFFFNQPEYFDYDSPTSHIIISNSNNNHNNNYGHLLSANYNGGVLEDNGVMDGYLLQTSNCHNSATTTMLIEPPHTDKVQMMMDSEGESNHSYTNLYPQENLIIPSVEMSGKLARRKPGRPPIKDKKSKAGGQRNSRLWEFIRDLLLDSKTCPSLLKWENVEEGIFRFVQSDKVARLWGERKCNPRMTYEKLSRAMRTYYSSQYLEPVPKTGKYPKKLVYKFGRSSHGWQHLLCQIKNN